MSRLAGALLSILLVYFGYHALAGEQGLNEWRRMQVEAQKLEADLAEVEADITRLETMIERLAKSDIDEDYVEELIHDRLIYAHKSELMLVR